MLLPFMSYLSLSAVEVTAECFHEEPETFYSFSHASPLCTGTVILFQWELDFEKCRSLGLMSA